MQSKDRLKCQKQILKDVEAAIKCGFKSTVHYPVYQPVHEVHSILQGLAATGLHFQYTEDNAVYLAWPHNYKMKEITKNAKN